MPLPLPPMCTSRLVAWCCALTVLLSTLSYAVRLFDWLIFDLRPQQFVQRGPFVSFMPDYTVVYAVAFGMGAHSGPRRWNVLARLPSAATAWLLACGGMVWLLLGWLPGVALFALLAGQRGVAAGLGMWAFRTVVEQAFAVTWSAGLLLLFRDAFNAPPKGWLGRAAINGAYGAYIIHPMLVTLLAWGTMSAARALPSSVVTATILLLPVTIGSWALAVCLRLLPGADRVL